MAGFHPSSNAGDFVLLLILVGYIVSLLRDWRPIKTLRQENSDLRATNVELSKKCEVLERKYQELEGKYAQLEKSRDFQAAFADALKAIEVSRVETSREHAEQLVAIADLDRRKTEVWTELARDLSSLSATVQALATSVAISKANQEGT